MLGTSPQNSSSGLLDSLRGLLRRHRRIVAALLAAVCVLIIMGGRSGADPMVDLVTAAQDIPAGTTLSEADLAVTPVPVALTTSGSYEQPGLLVGKIITTPLLAGELITTTRVLGTRPQTQPGEVLVPVRLADSGAAGLLAPGDIVSIIAASVDGQARIIARNARVVAQPIPPAGFTSQSGSLVLLAVSRDEAVELAAVSIQRALTAVLQ